MKEKIKSFLRKIFLINDTPHKIALGAACGVFWGALPGTGPAVALGFAFLIKANRLAAVTAGVLFNTWTNFAFFPFAVKLGAFCFGSNAKVVGREAMHIVKDFHWGDFFKVIMGKYFLVLAVGYAITAFLAAVIVYGLTFLIIIHRRARKAKKEENENRDIGREGN